MTIVRSASGTCAVDGAPPQSFSFATGKGADLSALASALNTFLSEAIISQDEETSQREASSGSAASEASSRRKRPTE